MTITAEAALKALKTSLPQVCIIALAWVCYYQFQINQQLQDARINDTKEQAKFWHDAFTGTTDALKNVCPQDHEHPSKDSSSAGYSSHSR